MFSVIKPNLPFSKDALGVFFTAAGITVKAMAGIFIVILIFYFVILILRKIFS